MKGGREVPQRGRVVEAEKLADAATDQSSELRIEVAAVFTSCFVERSASLSLAHRSTGIADESKQG